MNRLGFLFASTNHQPCHSFMRAGPRGGFENTRDGERAHLRGQQLGVGSQMNRGTVATCASGSKDCLRYFLSSLEWLIMNEVGLTPNRVERAAGGRGGEGGVMNALLAAAARQQDASGIKQTHRRRRDRRPLEASLSVKRELAPGVRETD